MTAFIAIFFVVRAFTNELTEPLAVQNVVEYLLLVTLTVVYTNYRMDVVARRHFLISRTLRRKENEIITVKQEAERMLRNILPASISDRLIRDPHASIADPYEQVTILFCSISNLKERHHFADRALVQTLNEIICDFDEACDAYGVEKIKTIGATYMAMAGGLPSPFREHHTQRMILFVARLQRILERFNEQLGADFKLRAGINVGPVVAGVIGTQKFFFDVWGDTVNVASRMETTGVDGRVQVTSEVVRMAHHLFAFERRGTISIKGRGKMKTFFLRGLRADADAIYAREESEAFAAESHSSSSASERASSNDASSEIRFSI